VVIGEGRIHTVPVGLAQGTLGVGLPNGVGVLRDGLLGLGLLTDTGNLGRLGLSTVHPTVGTPRQSTIAARRTLPCNTLAGSLTRGLELLELGSQFGNFGEQLVHGRGRVLGREGSFVKNDPRERDLGHYTTNRTPRGLVTRTVNYKITVILHNCSIWPGAPTRSCGIPQSCIC